MDHENTQQLTTAATEDVIYQYRVRCIHPCAVDYGKWGAWETIDKQKLLDIELDIGRGYTNYETRECHPEDRMTRQRTPALYARPHLMSPAYVGQEDLTDVDLFKLEREMKANG